MGGKAPDRRRIGAGVLPVKGGIGSGRVAGLCCRPISTALFPVPGACRMLFFHPGWHLSHQRGMTMPQMVFVNLSVGDLKAAMAGFCDMALADAGKECRTCRRSAATTATGSVPSPKPR